MISRTSRYAFRILGFLVENRGRRFRGEEIAEATGIPANYLRKILNQLRKRGFVLSEKGWGGGFELREDARNLAIEEILQVFDGAGHPQDDCVFGLRRCDSNNPCPLHPHWAPIRSAIAEMTRSISVKDLGRSPV